MDDGSCNQRKKVYSINTQGFVLSDQHILIKALKQNFDLNFYLRKDRTYYLLILASHCNQAFTKLIQPYLVESFQYKLLTK